MKRGSFGITHRITLPPTANSHVRERTNDSSFIETRFDKVADRHQANEAVSFNDKQIAEALARHARQGARDAVIATAFRGRTHCEARIVRQTGVRDERTIMGGQA